jgi:hypothetical protein
LTAIGSRDAAQQRLSDHLAIALIASLLAPTIWYLDILERKVQYEVRIALPVSNGWAVIGG